MIKLKGVQKCLNTESLNKFQKSNMLLIIRQYILLLFSVSSFFIISTSVIEAQPTRNSTGLSLQGTVVDNADKALRGASVAVVSQRDKNFKSGVVTDKDGKFKLDNLPAGEYSIEISFIGFRKHTQSFKLSPNNRNIGTVKLEEGDVNLGEITVEAQMLRQEQKEDTTIYNADAFKVNPDATTEDLLKKMPGVTVDRDGTVNAQGESISRVLVDGKEFFGEDPTVAIKSLPAEIIDKIQVFDRASDQAQFTGFDDGNAQKTLNIITKSDKNTGNFGKLYAGYGSEDRYWAGGNVNYFDGDMRISLIGLTNNINQQNFAVSDILSTTGSQMSGRGGFRGARGPGRGGRGMGSASDFMVGQQNGISATNSIGTNYSDTWSEGMTFTGSYFFNLSDNENVSDVSRNFFTQDESTQFYNESNNSTTRNINHRFNGRFDYTIDSSNSLLIRPRFTFQTSEYSGLVDGKMNINSADMNRTENRYTSGQDGYNIDNTMLYRLKLPKNGRTFSVELSTNVNKNDGNTYLFSRNTVYDTDENIIELNQDGNLIGDGYRINTEINYTEPIFEDLQLQLTYRPSYTVSNSDKEVYNMQPDEVIIMSMDSVLSNNFENIYKQHRGGVRLRYRTEETNINLGLDYQTAELEGKQNFPFSNSTKFAFSDFLPNFRLQHNLSKTTNFRINYRSSTNAPSVSQLQDVVDNSNPVLLKAGNPNLKQNYTHTLMGRVGTSDFKSSSFLFGFAMLRFTNDYIANSLYTANRDTSINGIPLFAGSQISRPVNLDGYVMGRSFAAYGVPVSFIGSNLNLNAGFTYTRTPGLVNNIENIANNYSINSGITLSSNISPELDFTLSYSGNYSIVENSILPNQDNNYFIHVATANVNVILWEKLVLNTEVFHNMYQGLEQDFNQEFLLWNASIGYKFLDKNAAEVRLSVYDILGQNNSINRNVTEIYLEDLRTRVLQRYFMLTFTYNLRSFGG